MLEKIYYARKEFPNGSVAEDYVLESGKDDAEKIGYVLVEMVAHDSAVLADARRFQWLEQNLSETPLNTRLYVSEVCPDIRLIWKMPDLVSYTCVGTPVGFRDAIDYKMVNE